MARFSTLHRAVSRLTLLTLLALPLACDREPTAPAPKLPTKPEVSILTPPPSLIPDFDASQYFSIDVQRAAQTQRGASATAVALSNHLYGWRAKVGTQLYSIDMQRAVADQYGSGYILGAVGVGVYDWRAVKWSALANRVLPVMPIGSDYFWNVSAVQTGLANFRSVLIAIRNWYGWRAGKSFRLLQPLVVPLQSNQTAAQWNALANLSTQDAHRYDFMNAAIAEYQRSYPAPGSALRAVIVPFTGTSLDIWNGAASTGSYAVEAPRGTSITCPATGPLDSRCADATYAIGHELGHTLIGEGNHSCYYYPDYPNCEQSIMQWGKPQDAILIPDYNGKTGEISKFNATPFFFVTY